MSLFGQLYKQYKEKHIVHSQEEFLKLVFGNDTANSITSPNYYCQIFKQDIPREAISDRITFDFLYWCFTKRLADDFSNHLIR